VDENNLDVPGITVNPNKIKGSVPVIQQGGYRDMAVKVMTTGQLATGYRLKNISASPLLVTVYSENLPLIESLPGYVETAPIDISGASENITTHAALALPSGVLLIGDQTVSVSIEIVAIEDSRPVAFRQVELIGLSPDLEAQTSPVTVDVILAGPLSVLNSLEPSDVHVRLDLTDLAVGTYQLTPTVVVAKQGVTVQSILPGTVEVVITKAAASTRTPRTSPTPTSTPTSTPTPTKAP
jgi:YbbR domain-containing protein